MGVQTALRPGAEIHGVLLCQRRAWVVEGFNMFCCDQRAEGEGVTELRDRI
jgi:hypothetical protein